MFGTVTRCFVLATVIMVIGCASAPPGGPAPPMTPEEWQQARFKRIVGLGAQIGLDISEIKDGDATEAERVQFQKDVEEAIALIGASDPVAVELSGLLSAWLTTGALPEDSWKKVCRVLINWAAPPPGPAPVPQPTPAPPPP